MAGTLTVNMAATLVHSPISEQILTISGLTIAQATLGIDAGIVIVGTSEEDMGIGDISTEGILIFQNLDSANYVTWGPKSGGSMVACGQIKAGEFAFFRMDSAATIRWIANTAAVKLRKILLET